MDNLIRINFELGEGIYTYRDCITLTEEEHSKLSEEDIENIKLTRYNNWLNFINTPPEVESSLPQNPTEE